MERRKLNFTTFEDILSDVDMIHEKGYVKLGKWDLAQNLEHIRLTMESATQQKNFGIPPFIRWILRKTFLKSLLTTRRMKSGFQTSKLLLPKPGAEDKEHEAKEISAFKDAVSNFSEHQGEYLPNPAFGTLSRKEWQEVQKIHCAHHLSFLVPNAD